MRCEILRRVLFGLVAAALLAPHDASRGQGRAAGTDSFRQALQLHVDNEAVKKFAAIGAHLRARQWDEAIDALRQAADLHGDSLVPSARGRFVNVRTLAAITAAGFPDEGLAAYRKRMDPLLQETFERGRTAGDAALLERVVREGYACSFADEALLRLGDLAWGDGELARARSFWEQVLPPRVRPASVLQYPDSEVEPALVRARLILCSLAQGERERAARELAEFARRHPEARGTIAGKTGKLAEILAREIESADDWAPEFDDELAGTLGHALSRNGTFPKSIEFASVLWSVKLPGRTLGIPGLRHGLHPALVYYPVVHGQTVLVQDDRGILALDRQTGRAAWPVDDEPDDAYIFREGGDVPGAGGWNGGGRSAEATRPNTLTVADGRLYALIGARAVSADARAAFFEARGFRDRGPILNPLVEMDPAEFDRPSQLICLNLESEGLLEWQVSAAELLRPAEELPREGPAGGGLLGPQPVGTAEFEGAPLVENGRLYIGLRTGGSSPSALAACLDALTGRVVWVRRVCQAPPGNEVRRAGSLLTTLGGGRLFYATDMGVTAALDPATGVVQWAVTYPRVEVDNLLARRERALAGLLPAVYHEGTVYVAPPDARLLLAIDADTGGIRWQRELPRIAHSLLGVARGRVFVAGSHLTAYETLQGRTSWQVGSDDPESSTFGRGVLAGDEILWPVREEIWIVGQERGELRRRVHLAALMGASGGNLSLTDGLLLIASHDQLAACWEYGRLREQLDEEIEVSSHPARAAWLRALAEQQRGNFEAAHADWRRAQASLRPGERWWGRDLAAVLRDGRRALLLAEAASAHRARQLDRAAERLEEAWRVGGSPAQQVETARRLAAVYEEAEQIERAVGAWQRILSDVRLRTARRRRSDAPALSQDGSSNRAELWGATAAAGLQRLLRDYGSRPYARWDGEAQERLAGLPDERLAAELPRLIREYPASARLGDAIETRLRQLEATRPAVAEAGWCSVAREAALAEQAPAAAGAHASLREACRRRGGRRPADRRDVAGGLPWRPCEPMELPSQDRLLAVGWDDEAGPSSQAGAGARGAAVLRPTILVESAGSVAQFSAATGAEEWRVLAHERVRDLAALPGRWVLLGTEGAWCLDAQGKPCWRAEREDGATDVSPRLIPVRHSAPANAAGGAAELPVTLLMWHGKSLAAVDPANGDASWRCSVDGARAIVAGLDCFVVCQSGGMSVHSLSDGTIRAWIDGQPFSPEGLAAAGSGRFLWGDADGALRAFDGRNLFRHEGPSSHAHRHPLPIVPAPAQAADLLLAVIDGSVLARVDAKAGAVREARTAADAINGWDWLQEIEWAAVPSAMKPAPAESLPLVDLWRVPLASGPALGTSRGIVANSQRVVAAAGGRIVCLDSNSGRKIWEAEVGRPDSCWEPGTAGTDLVAGVSRVSGAIEFVLLDAQSGVELQRLRCEAPAVETAAPFGWNVNASGAVIFCGNLIWCIEAAAEAVPPTN